MLERTAFGKLADWKNQQTQQGLLVTGARQVGKTTLIREFGKQNYSQVAEINFLSNPQAIETVSKSTSISDLVLRLSALSNTALVPKKTLVFLDEIQECQDVITWIKFLKEATDLDFVLSGSLLGIDLYNARSIPVGFVQEIQLFPFTFQEFCMANKLPENLWELMESCFKDRNPVPEFLHSRLMELFYKYLLCGGMPDAVNTFVERNDLPSVRNVQRAIYHAYEADITKYVENAIERKHIKNIYESIPAQLNSQNKRFKFTKLGNGSRFAHMQTAFDWLESAGIALPAMRTSTPEYPLGLSADVSSFKLFMNDVGLLTSRLMGNTDINILNGRSSMNFGSIFENVVAQELRTAGFELFYYNNNRIGEVDFLVQNNRGQISLIEVKSGKDYKRHRAMSNLLAIDNYDFAHSYVFHDGNVRIEGHIEYLPIYMVNLLSPYSS